MTCERWIQYVRLARPARPACDSAARRPRDVARYPLTPRQRLPPYKIYTHPLPQEYYYTSPISLRSNHNAHEIRTTIPWRRTKRQRVYIYLSENIP